MMAPVTEIPRRQRDLVDTCFEEQLYDGGLGILDRIRTPSAVTSPQHIRQLLYLALYPPVADRKEIKKQVVKRKAREKLQVSEIPPPDRAIVELSLSTLYHFIRTNDARDVLRSIPSYEHALEDDSESQADNRLAYHAACITQAKHCWDILSPDYILPEGCPPIPWKRCQLVAEHSWSVFDWLVEAFEQDAANAAGVSALLADQLPKSGGGPKTIMNIPLDIVVASFSEPLDQRRMDSGARLMALLVALTKATPPLLFRDRLLSETCRRLTGMGTASFSTFLTKLEDPQFKCALACAFISQHSGPTGQSAYRLTDSRRSRQTPPPTSSTSGRKSKATGIRSSGSHMFPIERVLEIVRLNARIQDDLAGEGDEDEGEVPVLSEEDQVFKHATMKLHLLGSLGGLGVWQEEAWRASVKDGRLKQSIQIGFEFGERSDADQRLTGFGLAAAALGDVALRCL